nr:hypothetical protein [Tanacetum cinerariifolium]
MFNPFSEEKLTIERISTLSELATLDEAIAEHNEGLLSNSQDLGNPQGTNGQSSVEILQSIPAIQVVPSQSSVEFVQDVPVVQIVPSQLTSNALHNAIMEAGGKDRPPMLAPGNYVQWKSRIKRYIDTKPNHELIYYCLQNPPYKYKWADKDVSVTEGSSETTTERYMENYKNVSQDIRDQLNAEAEAVQIILTGIDNDIYSTVDACPNACDMWKAIKRLKQESRAENCLLSQTL